MSNESGIENYSVLSENLCERWGNPHLYSDEKVKGFLAAALLAIVRSLPDDDLDEVKLLNEADDDLELLVDMIETNCRHNNYGAMNEQ